jgi:cytoskeletal protein CcmA (bactofilin family)
MIGGPLRQGRDETTVFKRRSTKPEDESQGAATPASPSGLNPQGQGGSAPAARPADNGLGVPPFRPAPPKEKDLSDMARPPFAPNSSAVPTMPPAPGAMRPGIPPQTRTPGLPDSAERRMLVVGRGISVQGTINDAERLVVEGTVEATLIHAAELSVIDGGVFKGEIEVEEAEIAGTIDGVVTARTSLIVRATGRVLGKARCRRLQVEDGGQITGQIEMLTNAPSAASPAPSPVSTTGLQNPIDSGRPDVPASEV